MKKTKSTVVEVWRAVPGYEGFYSVSSLGRVRSEDRAVTGKLGSTRRLPGKLMCPTPDSNGYMQVRLSLRTNYKTWKVHKLVLIAFTGEKPVGMQCCHNDGDKTNNTAENLRYDSVKGNCADRIKHGTQQRGERVFTAKLTEEQVKSIKSDQRGCREIARHYGLHHGSVSSIKTGKTWGWL